jgi:hypothetical protein
MGDEAMIEFGATLLLVTLAGFVLAMIEPARNLATAIIELIDGIDTHRRAQAGSVLKHAGLMHLADDGEED